MAFMCRSMKRSLKTAANVNIALIGRRSIVFGVSTSRRARLPMMNLLNSLKRNRMRTAIVKNNPLGHVQKRGVFTQCSLFRSTGSVNQSLVGPVATQGCFPVAFASVLKANFSNGVAGTGPKVPDSVRELRAKVAEKRKSNLKFTRYIGSISNFIYPISGDSKDEMKNEFSQRKNLEFSRDWIKNSLSTTTRVADLRSPSVIDLKRLTEEDPIIRMLINRALDEAIDAGLIIEDSDTIYDIDYVLMKLEDIQNYAPALAFDEEGKADPGNTVTTPIALVYGPLAMTESGEALSYNSKMNKWWKQYLCEWYRFLSSSDSAEAANSWVTDPDGYAYMAMDDYVIPADGYKTWNEFFIRELKSNVREIDEPDDNSVIVSGCDAATWNYENNVTINTKFWIKDQKYDLKTLLNNDVDLINRYDGGQLFQTVLFPDDYHRWRSCVSGEITRSEIIGDTYWTQTNFLFENQDGESSDTSDLKYWTSAVPYMSHLNIRSIIEIDTTNSQDGNIGKVLFISVGLNEISSLVNTVQIGDTVKKGESQLGYFQYGGSTVIYIFPKNTIVDGTNGWNPQIIPPTIGEGGDTSNFNPINDALSVRVGQFICNANIIN